MVTRAQKVAIRYVTANVADMMERALDHVDQSKVVSEFNLLGGLLLRVSRDTKINNPEISEQAMALSKVFVDITKFMRGQVMDAIQGTRNLLDSVVF